MRESRTYGSGRGACDEMHVPTATCATTKLVRSARTSVEAREPETGSGPRLASNGTRFRFECHQISNAIEA